MKNPNLPPFYVGQRIVRIGMSYPEYGAIKGNEYVVKLIYQCTCGDWKLTVEGAKPSLPHQIGICGCGQEFKIGFFTGRAKSYAPIESTFESISFKKVVEIESPLIGIN